MALLEKGEAVSRYGIRRADIDSGIARVQSQVQHVQLEEDFIWMRTSEGMKGVRWSLVESYRAPERENDNEHT